MLAENSNFAKIVNDHGFKFIGPKYEHIEKIANKIEAKSIAKNIGLPTLTGSKQNIKDLIEAKEVSENIRYPVIIKSTNGGGGRGIKVVHKENELKSNFLLAKKEAEQSFGNGDVYIEKFLSNPRHIEVQILSDFLNIVLKIKKENARFKEETKK